MSSIASYLIDTKNIVFGYDRSSNKLVDKLIDNGLKFTDKLDIDLVPKEFLEDNVIVVYTPAVKNDNIFLEFFSLWKIQGNYGLGSIPKNPKMKVGFNFIVLSENITYFEKIPKLKVPYNLENLDWIKNTLLWGLLWQVSI